MKIVHTKTRRLLELPSVPFTAKTVALFEELARLCPNFKVQAYIVGSGIIMNVHLHEVEWDFQVLNVINSP